MGDFNNDPTSASSKTQSFQGGDSKLTDAEIIQLSKDTLALQKELKEQKILVKKTSDLVLIGFLIAAFTALGIAIAFFGLLFSIFSPKYFLGAEKIDVPSAVIKP